MSFSSRIAVVFGTRPEAIKLAPVILALRRQAAVECRVCVTAQHRQMLDQVLEVFGIRPDRDLDLMRADQTLADFTARALHALDGYLAEDRPDFVLVQGDTTTVFCAALACFYRRIPVGHVEAGLRTGDLYAPWPEEANRVLTSRLAALHFAPTEAGRRNLLQEGIPADRIFVTGNTVIDALHLAREAVRRAPPALPELPADLQPGTPVGRPPLVLITGHRRENFGEGFQRICRAVARLAAAFPETQFVYPVHLNPNVRQPVFDLLAGRDNVRLIEPLPYLAFVGLMDRSSLILTDSGGVQEEAPSLGKPVLVMRDKTERAEGVEAGVVRLVGTDEDRIVAEVSESLRGGGLSNPDGRNPYGDGRAAERIVSETARYLGERTDVRGMQ